MFQKIFVTDLVVTNQKSNLIATPPNTAETIVETRPNTSRIAIVNTRLLAINGQGPCVARP